MSASDLQDCGHVGDWAGVCQFQGCAKQLCTKCVQDCAACGITICDEHQEWLDGGTQVFCPDCSGDHVKQKAGFFLLDRFIGGQRRGGT